MFVIDKLFVCEMLNKFKTDVDNTCTSRLKLEIWSFSL